MSSAQTSVPGDEVCVPGSADQLVRRAYKFRLYPTRNQEQLILEMFRDHRNLYNCALEHRKTMYREHGATINYYDQSKEIKEIRAEDEKIARWACNSLHETLRKQQKAMDAFFRRVKRGETPGYPRFKGEGRFNSVVFPKHGNGVKWDSTSDLPNTRVYAKGIGHIKVRQHRAVEGEIKTVTIKRELDQWYVVLSCAEVPVSPLPETGKVVGIDMGVKQFLTTSDGKMIENPTYYRETEKSLSDAQNAVTRCRRGSKRQKKARERVARIHRKTRRQRDHFQHQVANDLIRSADVICRESLSVASMSRRPSPKLDPENKGAFLPNQATAKSGLNKSILDASWSSFFHKLEYKAESAGRRVIEVPAAFTSQRCGSCGRVSAENRRSQAEFVCVECGFSDHADVNAARNILFKGCESPSSGFADENPQREGELNSSR